MSTLDPGFKYFFRHAARKNYAVRRIAWARRATIMVSILQSIGGGSLVVEAKELHVSRVLLLILLGITAACTPHKGFRDRLTRAGAGPVEKMGGLSEIPEDFVTRAEPLDVDAITRLQLPRVSPNGETWLPRTLLTRDLKIEWSADRQRVIVRGSAQWNNPSTKSSGDVPFVLVGNWNAEGGSSDLVAVSGALPEAPLSSEVRGRIYCLETDEVGVCSSTVVELFVRVSGFIYSGQAEQIKAPTKKTSEENEGDAGEPTLNDEIEGFDQDLEVVGTNEKQLDDLYQRQPIEHETDQIIEAPQFPVVIEQGRSGAKLPEPVAEDSELKKAMPPVAEKAEPLPSGQPVASPKPEKQPVASSPGKKLPVETPIKSPHPVMSPSATPSPSPTSLPVSPANPKPSPTAAPTASPTTIPKPITITTPEPKPSVIVTPRPVIIAPTPVPTISPVVKTPLVTPTPTLVATPPQVRTQKPEASPTPAAVIPVAPASPMPTPVPNIQVAQGDSQTTIVSPVEQAPSKDQTPEKAQKAMSEAEAQAAIKEKYGDQSIGAHSRGSLRQPTNLKAVVEKMGERSRIRVVHPNQRNYYGNYSAIEFLVKASLLLNRMVPGMLLEVGDISDEDGGRLRPHKSHQNGLDIDVGFFFEGKTQGYYGTNATKGKALTPNFATSLSWKFFKTLMTYYHDKIYFILVAPAVKQAMCAEAVATGDLVKGKEMDPIVLHTLRRLVPERSHYNHFHVRLKCPAKDERCVQTQRDLAVTTGCFPTAKK